MKLWICGKCMGDISTLEFNCAAWEFQGVFDSEEQAIIACTSPNYFVGPVTLGEYLPDESVQWDESYYPYYGKE